MKVKTLVTAGLLAFVVVSLGVAIADVAGLREMKPREGSTPNSAKKEQWVTYYLHSSHRCPTCRGIEANTRAAVAEKSVDDAVELRVLNFEEPAYRHFAVDFDLAFPGVILAQEKDGSILRWKNLDRVWELWQDRPAFVSYLRTELAMFKEGRP